MKRRSESSLQLKALSLPSGGSWVAAHAYWRRTWELAVSLLASAPLSACRGRQSALDPRGPQAAELDWLWHLLWIGGAAVYIVVMALLVAGLLVKSAPGANAPERDPNRQRWVLAGTGITIAILVGILVVNVLTSRTLTAQPEAPLRVRVVGHQWWWEVTYQGDPASNTARTANELHFPVGRPVELTLEARDVIHSFWIPNLHGKADMIPGRTNKLVLQADEPGIYRGQCAEFCGLQHAHMAFFVVVESEADFARWLENERRPAVAPTDPLAKEGQEVFLSTSCAFCHAIRGTNAMAAAGPDLTHIAGRMSLAAATAPNTRGTLGGWILDPQHLKPGSFMPASELGPEQLHALLHYLESLK